MDEPNHKQKKGDSSMIILQHALIGLISAITLMVGARFSIWAAEKAEKALERRGASEYAFRGKLATLIITSCVYSAVAAGIMLEVIYK